MNVTLTTAIVLTFAFVGILGTDYYKNQKAAEFGMKTCIVQVNNQNVTLINRKCGDE